MTLRTLLSATAALLVAMCSIQSGASLAKQLFPLLGPVGATTLRLLLAATLLALLYRPWRGASLAGQRLVLLGYGGSLGLMNLCYYLALERVPMGIVVALEFTGPLAVALMASRRGIDFLWILLAAAGLLLLLPLAPGNAGLDGLGLALALLSGLFWALYIVFGTRAGAVQGGRSVALGMVVAAFVVLPLGLGSPILTATTWQPAVLATGLGVALLSSVLPYTMEMWAMQRLPTRTFGIFMSLEPAIATLAGFLWLGEHLTALQGLAIVLVMAASLGSAATATRAPG